MYTYAATARASLVLKETFSFRCAHDLFDSKDSLSRAKAGTKLTQSSNRTERGIGILAKKLRKRFVFLQFKFRIVSLYQFQHLFHHCGDTIVDLVELSLVHESGRCDQPAEERN